MSKDIQTVTRRLRQHGPELKSANPRIVLMAGMVEKDGRSTAGVLVIAPDQGSLDNFAANIPSSLKSESARRWWGSVPKLPVERRDMRQLETLDA